MGDRFQWLAFTPRYRAVRREDRPPTGAHAFAPDAARSLCNYVARDRVGGEAGPERRRCPNCARAITILQRMTEVTPC